MSDKKQYDYWDALREYDLHGTLCKPAEYTESAFSKPFNFTDHAKMKFHLQEKEPKVVYEYLWEYQMLRDEKWRVEPKWLTQEEALSIFSVIRKPRIFNLDGIECKRVRE